jgi:hypothetical protein
MRLNSNGTKRRRRVFSVALVLTVLSTALIAGPAAAATPPGSDYGNTVECRYKTKDTGPGYDYRLKRLVVTAPVLFGNKGSTAQMVGWRFIVTRSMNYNSGPWNETYRSPIQKSTATATNSADFTAQSVGVTIPEVDNIISVQYRVTLKLLRYRNDGSLKSKVTYQMPYMKIYTNGQYNNDWASECVAGFYEGP